MQHVSRKTVILDRFAFIGLGALVGLAFWQLSEHWDDSAWPPAVFLAVFTFVSVHSAVLLALIGPVGAVRALLGALVVSVPTTLLVSWAGQRYEQATQLLDQTPALSLTLLMVFLATPFLSVALRDRRAWRDYALLFETAWSLSARYVLAWVFVAVFWLLILLSDALLGLVRIGILQQLLETEWLVFGLSGAVLGLGLAVVHELRDRLSPFVVLRLLRLLVPLVLAVVALFLMALPLRGLSELFGGVSSAGTLMSAAIVSISLVSIAVDRDDRHMVATPGLILATKALAALQPFLAGLALWAVVLRVQQYGWTPDRVVAALGAVVISLYALGYLGAVLSGRAWTLRLRQVNIAIALVLTLASGLWLTPLLDANRISTNSQITRFEAGELAVGDLAFWSMQHDWGRAGQAGLTRLQSLEDHPDRAELARNIEVVRTQPDRYRFEQEILDQRAPEELAHLIALMPQLPDGQAMTVADLRLLPDYRRTQWLDACERHLPDGRPGCALVHGEFLPTGDRQAMVLFLDAYDRVRVTHLSLLGDEVMVQDAYDLKGRTWPVLEPEVLMQVLDGSYALTPRGGQALSVGGQVIEAVP
ncbi:MAG: DUF4153 domain-containing protein [Rhodobacteraceae bacterium]|nr:DUF4153 domain-containing protein [Paracoccaceae bacterium]